MKIKRNKGEKPRKKSVKKIRVEKEANNNKNP